MWCEWEDKFEILEYFLFSTIKHRYSALDWCFSTRGEAVVIFLLKLSEFRTQVQYCMTLYPLQPYHKGFFILKSLKERKKKKRFYFCLKEPWKKFIQQTPLLLLCCLSSGRNTSVSNAPWQFLCWSTSGITHLCSSRPVPKNMPCI